MNQLIGKKGTYSLFKRIGHGSTSEVFLGINELTKQQYAIKKISPIQFEANIQQFLLLMKERQMIFYPILTRVMSINRQMIDLFQNRQGEDNYFDKEIETLEYLARFDKHQNVMGIEEIIRDEKNITNVYVVQEYCSEGNLFDFQAQHFHQFDLETKLEFSIQIARGIQYLHQKNIIHRDLKPENFFISKLHTSTSRYANCIHANYCVKVGDFGISKVNIDDEYTRSMVGTPSYMPPEIFKNQNYSYAIDIWSFGCIMFEIFNCTQLINGCTVLEIYKKTMSHNSNDIIYVKDFQESESINEIIKKCLKQDPLQRLKIDDILNQLLQIQEKILKTNQTLSLIVIEDFNKNHDISKTQIAQLGSIQMQNQIYKSENINVSNDAQTMNYQPICNSFLQSNVTQKIMEDMNNYNLIRSKVNRIDLQNSDLVNQQQSLLNTKPECSRIAQKELNLMEDQNNSEPYLDIIQYNNIHVKHENIEIENLDTVILCREENDIVKITKTSSDNETQKKDNTVFSQSDDSNPVQKQNKIFTQSPNKQYIYPYSKINSNKFLQLNPFTQQLNDQNQETLQNIQQKINQQQKSIEQQKYYQAPQNIPNTQFQQSQPLNNISDVINSSQKIKKQKIFSSQNNYQLNYLQFQQQLQKNSSQKLEKPNLVMNNILSDSKDHLITLSSPLTPDSKIKELNLDQQKTFNSQVHQSGSQSQRSTSSQFNITPEGVGMMQILKKKYNNYPSRKSCNQENIKNVYNFQDSSKNKKMNLMKLNNHIKSSVNASNLLFTFAMDQFYMEEVLKQEKQSDMKKENQKFILFNSFIRRSNLDQQEFNVAFAINFLMAQIILYDQALQNKIQITKNEELNRFKELVKQIDKEGGVTDFIEQIKNTKINSIQKFQSLFELSGQHRNILSRVDAKTLKQYLEKEQREKVKLTDYFKQASAEIQQEYSVKAFKQTLYQSLMRDDYVLQDEYFTKQLRQILKRDKNQTPNITQDINFIEKLKKFYLQENVNACKSTINQIPMKS